RLAHTRRDPELHHQGIRLGIGWCTARKRLLRSLITELECLAGVVAEIDQHVEALGRSDHEIGANIRRTGEEAPFGADNREGRRLWRLEGKIQDPGIAAVEEAE